MLDGKLNHLIGRCLDFDGKVRPGNVSLIENMIKLPDISVLDLAPIREGDSAAGAFRNSLDLARHAEEWGYERFWLAEHHNIPGIASAATSVVIGHIAGGTSRIRVGAGGIMLPNHAPLLIAEQFGTLAALYPGRIDLGLGRAPGGDQQTAAALRRNLASSGDTFPKDLLRNFSRTSAPPRPARPSGRWSRTKGRTWPDLAARRNSSRLAARKLAAERGLPVRLCLPLSRPTTCSPHSRSTATTSSPRSRSINPA